MIEAVKNHAEKLFEGARGSHDWEHTLRVCRLCQQIGRAEGADMDVLMVAAYLHDIGRCYQDISNGEVCHAEKGAQMARPIVQALPLSPEQKENILHAVRSHRFRGNRAPETLEARVLFDADKLDAIGAVGVARAFLFAGEVGARLHNPEMNVEAAKPYSIDDTGYREFKVKLSRIKERILTREGRKLAAARHEFMVGFFKRFLREYEGKE
ncbi:MAG: HD domain-containing protein [Thermodesulfobacteriota bacterium]